MIMKIVIWALMLGKPMLMLLHAICLAGSPCPPLLGIWSCCRWSTFLLPLEHNQVLFCLNDFIIDLNTLLAQVAIMLGQDLVFDLDVVQLFLICELVLANEELRRLVLLKDWIALPLVWERAAVPQGLAILKTLTWFITTGTATLWLDHGCLHWTVTTWKMAGVQGAVLVERRSPKTMI